MCGRLAGGVVNFKLFFHENFSILDNFHFERFVSDNPRAVPSRLVYGRTEIFVEVLIGAKANFGVGQGRTSGLVKDPTLYFYFLHLPEEIDVKSTF